MITHSTYQTQLQMTSSSISTSNGLTRVFAAAVVSRQFCKMLLSDPITALQNGYLGETFRLSNEEHNLLISIHAENLADLARQVNKALQR
ncbi:MAG: hypothetical protein JNK81_09775 [Anaerolineales bacterium]|nr:hypothetical protein [Anaerolineales bacterium]